MEDGRGKLHSHSAIGWEWTGENSAADAGGAYTGQARPGSKKQSSPGNLAGDEQRDHPATIRHPRPE
jgi:hypothetical protein